MAEELFLKQKRDFLDNLGLRNFVQIGGVSNPKLNLLYNYALCLIYPSAYEGFGIPILEAQKAGCPVIATANSSIPEVIGEGGLLMNKVSVNNLCELIFQIKNSPELVTTIVEEGIKNSKRFSWDICYEQTKALYKEMYEEYF